MLSIVLSNPECTEHLDLSDFGDDISFGCLLSAIGEHSRSWLFDLGVHVERLLGKGSVVKRLERVEHRLTYTTVFEDDEIDLNANHGLRVNVSNVCGVDPDGKRYNLLVICHEGNVFSVSIVGAHELAKYLEPKFPAYPLFTPRRSGRYPWKEAGTMPQFSAINSPAKFKPRPVADVQTFGDPTNTVKVTFADGTTETAVCKTDDTFNLDVGIGICIAKHMMGNSFLRAISKAKKVYTDNKKVEEDRAKRLEEAKEVNRRKKAKADKRREQRREKRIEEQTEAIIRALLAVDSMSLEDEEMDIPEKPELTDELVQKMREKNND